MKARILILGSATVLTGLGIVGVLTLGSSRADEGTTPITPTAQATTAIPAPSDTPVASPEAAQPTPAPSVAPSTPGPITGPVSAAVITSATTWTPQPTVSPSVPSMEDIYQLWLSIGPAGQDQGQKMAACEQIVSHATCVGNEMNSAW